MLKMGFHKVELPAHQQLLQTRRTLMLRACSTMSKSRALLKHHKQ